MAAVAAMPIRMRADRAIMKRQEQEFRHETRMSQELEDFKVGQKGLWENKMAGVIRNSRVKTKAAVLEQHHRASLQDRRRMLAEKLSSEQKAYEQEMVDREVTPQQRMDQMAVRAYELKKRREDERKAVVQEKLYQQWRAGIDDLRTMDSKIVQMKTIADRDFQLDEKVQQQAEEKAHDEFYDNLWKEGHLAKCEREEREREMKDQRNAQQTKTLDTQLVMKQARISEEKAGEMLTAEEMQKLWAAQEEEEKQALLQQKVIARQERMKADEYMAIQQAQRAEEERAEKDYDRDFVRGVLDKEHRMAQQEEFERKRAKQKAVEFTEALKIEMARKAEDEEQLIRLQHEESERQWQKRYQQWEKEELARRALMEDVYNERADQVQLKQEMREKLKDEIAAEKNMLERESARLESIEKERIEGEMQMGKRHQEELFRQMDFHQVQRHRQLQQHAIEQRQGAIAEEKIRRAVKQEKDMAHQIMLDIHEKRATQRPHASLAPWDK